MNKTKAIFLDRDGVIIKERGEYTFRPEDVELVSGIYPFLRQAKQKGYFIVVISNQGGIALKKYTKSDADHINQLIEKRLSKKLIDAWLYCPHHHKSEPCICRKPDSALFEKAIAKYKIDIAESYMIGDNERDIQAAEKVGIRGILIPANNLQSLVHLIS